MVAVTIAIHGRDTGRINYRETCEFPCIVSAELDVAASAGAELQRVRGVAAPAAARLRACAAAAPLALLPRVWQQVSRRHSQILHRMWCQTTSSVNQLRA